MPKFIVARVNRDPADTHAATTPIEAIALALPDDGNKVELWEVDAPDAGAARLMLGKPCKPGVGPYPLTCLTYGCLPREDVFRAMFDRAVPSGDMAFRNDPRLGTERFSASEVWTAIRWAYAESENMAGHESAGDPMRWVSDVLTTIGIEWV